jgi:hypothetical protein
MLFLCDYFCSHCHTNIPRPTTHVGTRTDYSVGPWNYPTWAAQHLLMWSARPTED